MAPVVAPSGSSAKANFPAEWYFTRKIRQCVIAPIRGRRLISGMTFDPDHSHAHPHESGIKWLDITIGVSVVLISVISLVVSIQHGKTMEKMVEQNERMVAANTMPMLTMSGSNVDPATGAPRLSLEIKNGGVGPALIDWFEMRYKGVSYGDPVGLLHACCADAVPAGQLLPKGLVYSNISGSILPARESLEPIQISSKASKTVFLAVEKSRADLETRACYCSVLEECWLTDFAAVRPRRVKSCAVPKHGDS